MIPGCWKWNGKEAESNNTLIRKCPLRNWKSKTIVTFKVIRERSLKKKKKRFLANCHCCINKLAVTLSRCKSTQGFPPGLIWHVYITSKVNNLYCINYAPLQSFSIHHSQHIFVVSPHKHQQWGLRSRLPWERHLALGITPPPTPADLLQQPPSSDTGPVYLMVSSIAQNFIQDPCTRFQSQSTIQKTYIWNVF